MALPNEKRILSREAYDRPITSIYSNQQSKGNIYLPEVVIISMAIFNNILRRSHKGGYLPYSINLYVQLYQS